MATVTSSVKTTGTRQGRLLQPRGAVGSARSAHADAGPQDSFGRSGSTTGYGKLLGARPAYSVEALARANQQSQNPKLETLLQQNPQIRTNQDLINHFWQDGEWAGLVEGCKANDLQWRTLIDNRGGDVWDNVYPNGRPPLAPGVPKAPFKPFLPLQPKEPPPSEAKPQPSVPAIPEPAAPAGPTNPQLAAFLEQHPEIKTNQDFINFAYAGKHGGSEGYPGLRELCAQTGIEPGDVLNYRSADIRDLAYPAAPPNQSLPTTGEAADRFHIVQFKDPTYNPTGPSSSKNCGPASLAMVLDTQGKMPAGLSPEQKVDYARALMYPDSSAITHITVRGQRVPQLDKDGNTSNSDTVERGMEGAGLQGTQQSGWAELDAALAAGQPVVASGDCYPAWKNQFPSGQGRYGAGEIGHFISILGKTDDGKYIVCDPMYTGGPVEMSREQLAVFFNKNGNDTPEFIAAE